MQVLNHHGLVLDTTSLSKRPSVVSNLLTSSVSGAWSKNLVTFGFSDFQRGRQEQIDEACKHATKISEEARQDVERQMLSVSRGVYRQDIL